MSDEPVYMTCYEGPFDGNRVHVPGKPDHVNLEVPVMAPFVSPDAEAPVMPPARFARYRVSELVSDPGVPVLIYDDDDGELADKLGDLA